MPKLPTQLNDLSPSDYNPRFLDDEAREGLRESIDKFGDLSGLVFNFATSSMIAGHQRREELLKLDPSEIVWSGQFTTKHGNERLGQIKLPDGSIFTVRGVYWPTAKEKAANVAANNPLIAGTFTTGLASVLADLEGTDFAKGLRFDELPAFLPSVFTLPGADRESDDGGDGPDAGDDDGDRDHSPSGGGVKLVSLFYDDDDLETYNQLLMQAKVRFAASTPSAAVLAALKRLEEQGEFEHLLDDDDGE